MLSLNVLKLVGREGDGFLIMIVHWINFSIVQEFKGEWVEDERESCLEFSGLCFQISLSVLAKPDLSLLFYTDSSSQQLLKFVYLHKLNAVETIDALIGEVKRVHNECGEVSLASISAEDLLSFCFKNLHLFFLSAFDEAFVDSPLTERADRGLLMIFKEDSQFELAVSIETLEDKYSVYPNWELIKAE